MVITWKTLHCEGAGGSGAGAHRPPLRSRRSAPDGDFPVVLDVAGAPPGAEIAVDIYDAVQPGEPVGPEQALEAGDQWRRVEAALRGLPERTRRIFLLNRIHGRTYAEIAQAMQLSQSAVEKHMMRALDACKASLAGPAGEQARSAQP